MGQLWLDHLHCIHDSANTSQSPVTLSSLRDRVRLIHALKSATLPIHSHYFHPDLDGFLHKATIQSLDTYIAHYLPLIMHSISQASTTSPPVMPYPVGGTTMTSASVPPTSACPHPPEANSNSDILHPSLEETPHRKRNRRRQLARVLQALRDWAGRRQSQSKLS